MKILMLPLALTVLLLVACSDDTPPEPIPDRAAQTKPGDPKKYAGQGTVYEAQFKVLHDAKQLGKKMNEDAAKIDEQVNPQE